MDQERFVAQVDACAQTLYRTARSLLASPADCQDALQEALTKAWASRQRLREERYFRTWLTRIVINECRNIGRQRMRVVPVALPEEMAGAQKRTDEAIPTAGPDASMDAFSNVLTDSQKTLTALVEGLPEKQRLAVVLHYIEDLPIAEVARILRVPQSTVRGRLYEARKALKLEWARTEHDEGEDTL